MKFSLNLNSKGPSDKELIVISAFSKTSTVKKGKKETTESVLVNNHWHKDCKDRFNELKSSSHFKGGKGDTYFFDLANGDQVMVLGMGEKGKLTFEDVRKEFAKITKANNKKYNDIAIQLDHFICKNDAEQTIKAIIEGMIMANYKYEKFLSKKSEFILKEIVLDTSAPKTKAKKLQDAVFRAVSVSESINYARDLVNDPPNDLDAPKYAKEIEKDVKANLKRVKVKIMNKAQMKKENMDLFLSVNAGSYHEPRLVHLTYTPKKVTKKTKHIALVGKGLTFDSGGYSLKPSTSMINMKFDMAGSATVYGAFRAAAMLEVDAIVTCVLGMTDNAIGPEATYPDSIIKARNGMTVEILNTDAEGRLVLADCLDYTCDQNPDMIIDAATLTGAVLVSLGHEVCGIMGTNQKLVDNVLKSAKFCDEQMWQLPIIDSFHEDMKSPIADLKNIGGKPYAGSAKAAAFLSKFVKNDIPWAHLDIAGIGDAQTHLPYCQTGASGLIVRSLVDFITNVK